MLCKILIILIGWKVRGVNHNALKNSQLMKREWIDETWISDWMTGAEIT